MDQTATTEARARRIAAVLGGCGLAGGALTLLGWVLGSRILTDWTASGISMQPNSALAAICTGTALLAQASGRGRWVQLLGLLATALGAGTLLEHICGTSLGIDPLLFDGSSWSGGMASPGRMGPPASLSYLLLGLGMLFSRKPVGSRARGAASALGLLAAGIGLFGSVGYLLSAGPLYAVPALTAISFPSAVLLCILGVGLVTAIPERGPAQIVFAQSAAALLVRRALPFILCLPVLFAWLEEYARQTGLVEPATGTALLVLAVIALVCGVLGRASQTVQAYELAHAATLEARLRADTLLHNARDQFLLLDRDYRYIYVNDRVTQITGIPRERLLGQSLWELWPAVLGSPLEAALRSVMEQRRAESLEYYYEPWDRWFDLHFFPVPGDRVAALSVEITERKRAESSLRDAERRLRLVTDHAPVLLAHCDAEGRYQFTNKPYADRFGLAPQDIVGKRIPEVLGEEAYAQIRERIAQALAGHPVQFEVEMPYRLGETRFIHAACVPERDPGGRVVGFVAAILDITERKRAEEALRVSEQRFRVFADTAPAMLWTTDTHNACTFFSRGWFEYTGQTQDEAFGAGWLAAVHPDDRDATQERFLAAAQLREAFALDYRLLRCDGQYRWAIDSGRPRFDESGAWLGYIGSVIDVHERKLSEQALQEADRRKDEFLATLAHELRNPIAPIRNAVELLRSERCENSSLRWAHDVIDRQSQHMARLIDDLLDVSRITSGRLRLRKERVALSEVIRTAVETSRPLLDQARHQLRLVLPPETPMLSADPTRLAQVLANLLSNAARYTQPGGSIELRVEPHSAGVAISVLDNGTGIPADMLTKIFDLFVQVNPASEWAHGGLGIGLTLAQRLAQMHGGRIEALSDGTGKGSRFTVYLPVLEETPANARTASGAQPATSPHLRVLVADDHRDGAESLGLLLRSQNHEVEIVHSGTQAVSAALATCPDVALLDIGMPDCSGYEVARRLREHPSTRGAVLIAITGWGQEGDRRRSADAGFDHHLVKPVNWPALLELLASIPRGPR